MCHMCDENIFAKYFGVDLSKDRNWQTKRHPLKDFWVEICVHLSKFVKKRLDFLSKYSELSLVISIDYILQ